MSAARLFLKGVWGTFGTWWAASVGPCLWACVAAGAVVGAGATYATKLVMDGRVARAQLDAVKADKRVADFRTELATGVATATQQIADMQAKAAKDVKDRDERQAQAIAALPTEIRNMMRRELIPALRETVDAPEYDCLRRPLPDGFLRLLERPGGLATESR